jgi:FAD-linked oxidoreductase
VFFMKSAAPKIWSNWSGLVRMKPQKLVYPGSIEEVSELVRKAFREGKKIRVVGSGHSFTPLVHTDQILLSLDRMQGVESIDESGRTATVWAGTRLKDLGESLHSRGFSQENLGDINAQSVGGAIGTGTHGTGIEYGSISNQVVGVTVVTASGDVLECDENHHPELLRALKLSLGALGVLVKIRLRIVPRRLMHFQSKHMSLCDCLEQLEDLKREHRHFEFYWFPYTGKVQVKFMNPTSRTLTKNSRWNYFNKLLLENGAFWVLSESCRFFPKLCEPVSKLSARLIPVSEEVGYSHNLFATPRLVRFSEMEYSVPAEHMKQVLMEVEACVRKHRFAVHFPVECRYVKGDDLWLSPAYGRDSAFIAVHMYKGMPYEAYFRCVESIMRSYGGRPHWGKLHMMKTGELKAIYPKWKEFTDVRKQLDPKGVFLNSYLQELLGE